MATQKWVRIGSDNSLLADAPSYHRNQCWLHVSADLCGHWLRTSALTTILYNVIENYTFKITVTSSRDQWFKRFVCVLRYRNHYTVRYTCNTTEPISLITKVWHRSNSVLKDTIPYMGLPDIYSVWFRGNGHKLQTFYCTNSRHPRYSIFRKLNIHEPLGMDHCV